jgi:asparagine synthase (glutamine-hydrolysing)
VSHGKLSLDFRAKRFTAGAELDLPGSHFHWRVVLDEDAKRRVFRGGGTHPPTDTLFRDLWAGMRGDDLSRILRLDSSFHLPDDLMIKNDRMTMAHSIEARVPFTDLGLVGWLASVPSGVKLPGLRKKHLLRKAMQGILPGPVVRKKKVGLEMPYSSWLRRELRPLAEEVLSPGSVAGCGLLDPAGVRALWDGHMAMRADNGRALWGLLNYMVWHGAYISTRSYREGLRAAAPVAVVETS